MPQIPLAGSHASWVHGFPSSHARRIPSQATFPVPEGFSTVTPHLNVRDAAQALEFYKKAFGAKETVRMPGPGGKILHAEIKIGDSHIFLADEMPEWVLLDGSGEAPSGSMSLPLVREPASRRGDAADTG